MKKIPTLFKRIYDGNCVKGIIDEVFPGMEWVLAGDGLATVKIDGTCCAIIGGKFHRRYDAKRGRKPLAGSIPCCDPDPTTGHWPHWLPVDSKDPGSNWHLAAYYNAGGIWLPDGTYEAIGRTFRITLTRSHMTFSKSTAIASSMMHRDPLMDYANICGYTTLRELSFGRMVSHVARSSGQTSVLSGRMRTCGLNFDW